MRTPKKARGWCAAASVVHRLVLRMVCIVLLLPIGAPADTLTKPSNSQQNQVLRKAPLSICPKCFDPRFTYSVTSSLALQTPQVIIAALEELWPELHRLKIPAAFAALIIEALLIVGLIQHRSEGKSAKQALRRKEAELAETQYIADLGTWMWDSKTDAILCSRMFCTLVGIDTQQQIMGFHELSRFFTPEIWQQLTQNMKTALHTGGSFELELSGLRSDGMQMWVIVRGQAVHDLADQVQQLRGTMQSITDRKRTEQALLDSEERFHLMTGLVTVLVWWSGSDKQCTNVNQEWLKFTGRAMQEELGYGWLDKLHPDDLRTFLHICFSSANKGQNTTVEYRMQRNDGQYRWMRCTRSPRLSADGRFVGYMGCCVDVTDEKEAKIASAEFGSKLIRAQEEERARIARELHDDINQRLALLANGLQNFGSENPAADAQQINQNGKAQELWRLTNEIAADIQHLSHQLHPSKMRYLGLTAAVRDLCQGFSRQHDIAVECIVQDLPRILEDDVSLNLYRTIQECLHNVAKHSQARHVKVELTRKTTFLHLRVSDDGIGFNPADVVDKGLGLLSIRERLRSVGGELSIWSRPSLGTQLEGTVPTANHARAVQASVSAGVAY